MGRMKAGTPAGRVASLVVELGTGTAIVGDERIEIPPGEFDLLAVLASRAGKAIPSKELLSTLWPGDAIATEQDLRGRVYRLRKRLGDDKRTTKLVGNRPGFGYLIDLPPEAIEVVGRKSPSVEQEDQVVVLDPSPVGEPDDTTAVLLTDADAQDVPAQLSDRRVLRPVVVGLAAVAASALLAGSWLAGSWLSTRASADDSVAQVDHENGDSGRDAQKSVTKRRSQQHGRDRTRAAKVKGERLVRPVAEAGPVVVAGGAAKPQDQVEREPNPEAQRPKQQEAVEPAPRPDTRLFHLHHPDTGDHFVTTDSSAANQRQAEGYTMTMEGWVFRSQTEGTTAITLHGGSAFIYRTSSSAPDGVSVAPLYRLSSGSTFFFTSSSSQANQAEAQGWTRAVAGYVGA